MPRFLDPSGHSSYGIGLCARCGIKMYLDELYDDPNYPGLKVCMKHDDIDEYDPYRLPPRNPDQITLEFVRDDFPISTTNKLPIVPTDSGWPPADSQSPNGITYVKGT